MIDVWHQRDYKVMIPDSFLKVGGVGDIERDGFGLRQAGRKTLSSGKRPAGYMSQQDLSAY